MLVEKKKCAIINTVLVSEHDVDVSRQVFVKLLKQFSIAEEELEKYLRHSLSMSYEKGKFWAITPCECQKEACNNFVAKQLELRKEALCIKVQHHVEVSPSDDRDRLVLTHIFTGMLRMYEGKWAQRTASVSFKLHKIANNLSDVFIEKPKKELFLFHRRKLKKMKISSK